MKQLTDHFTLHEFRCRCGCKAEDQWIDEIKKTAEILELLRERINSKQEYVKYRKPLADGSYKELSIKINCGVRCPAHNATIPGAAPHSQHLSTAYGGAADTKVPGLPPELWFGDTEGFFRGRILYTKSKFVHLDRRIGNAYVATKEA